MKFEIKKKLRSYTGLFLILMGMTVSVPVFSQTWPDTSKKYQVYLEPYLFAAGLSGSSGAGQLPNAFICIPASEVLSHFQAGGMLYAEVHNDRFAYTSDLFYADLSDDVSSKNGIASGTFSVKQFWWELEGLYRVQPWLEFGVGARINNVKDELKISIGPPVNANKNGEKTATWVDPLIVTRLKGVINNKWMLQLRADMGGFGIGSQFAWQLQPDVYFRASKLFEIGLGYRFISMDYHSGTQGSSDWFLFDMEEYGPQLRIGFNF